MKEKMAMTELEKGNQLLQEGKLEDAIAAYRSAIELNPDISWSYHNLGEALAKLGQLDEAIAAFRRAIELKPDFSWSYHHLGDALDRQQQWEESATAFGKAIELNPEHFGTYVGLGNCLAKLGQLDEAIAAYRRASELNPDADWIHHVLANALQQRNQLDLAEKIASYRQMIELNPDKVEAYQNLLQIQPDNWELWLQLGNTLVQQGKLEDAIAAYRSAIEHNPHNQTAYYSLGECLAKLGQLEKAIAAYRQAIELSEQENQKAPTLEPTEDREEVIKCYRQAIEDNPDDISEYHKLLELEPDNQEVLLQLAQALVRQEQIEDAIATYRRLVELSPCEEYYQELGELLVKQEKWDEAIATYRRALEVNPEAYKCYHQLGEAIYQRVMKNPESYFNQYKSGESTHQEYQVFGSLPELCLLNDKAFLQATINLDDEDYVPEVYRVYLRRETSEGERESAIQWLRDGNTRELGIKLCRQLTEFKAILSRSIISIISICIDDSIELYRRAIEINPLYSESYYSLGDALVRQEKYDEAITCYEQIFEIKADLQKDKLAKVYYHIGKILELQGKQDESLNCYKKVVDIQPNRADVHFQMANLFQVKGQLDVAIISYKKAVEIDPHWPEAIARIGHIGRQLGKFKRNLSVEPVADSNLSLSVVIPTYNRVNRLKAALGESYLRTDRSDIEFLICDNDSDDNTAQVVRSFMENDARIRYVKNPCNLGANRNLFRGVVSAKAPIVMFLTDDDFVTEGFINLVLWVFENYPSVGLVHKMGGTDHRGGQIFEKGSLKGLEQSLGWGMTITGMAFRRDAVDYDSWQLECSVFPQIWLAANIAMRYDVYGLYAHTEQCIQNKYVFIDYSGELEEGLNPHTLLAGVRTKSMPWDWGIPELVNIGLHFFHQLALPTEERWRHYCAYFSYRPVEWLTLHVFPTWYAQDWEGTNIFLGRVLRHLYIRFSLIFWKTFIASLWSSSQVKIIDKILFTLLGCYMLIWRIIIYLREFTEPGLADIYCVNSSSRKDTPELKHSRIVSELESSFIEGYSAFTVVRDLEYELEE